MKHGRTLSLVMMVALSASAAPADAQDDDARRGPRVVVDVETIMSMRERLELSDAQVAQLDEWRRERVAERSETRAQMDELRSQLRAGQIERSDLMRFQEERRRDAETSQDESRTRLEGILGAEQLESWDGLVRERRAFARGRASARRGGRGAGWNGRSSARQGRTGIRGERPSVRRGRVAPGVRREGFRGPAGRDGEDEFGPPDASPEVMVPPEARR